MLNPKNCLNGQEQYEGYVSLVGRQNFIQYDYRDHDSELFSCVGRSLEACRQKRDAWLARRKK